MGNSTAVHITIRARDPERAIFEDALGIGEMTEDLDGVPLPWRLPPARLLRGERVQVRAALDDLTLEERQDVALGNEVDVLEVVRLTFIGGGTPGTRVGVVHAAYLM